MLLSGPQLSDAGSEGQDHSSDEKDRSRLDIRGESTMDRIQSIHVN